MVDIEEMEVEPAAPTLKSEERLLDAQEIEKVASSPLVTRVSTKMHLEALATKLRKESEALKRVEKSHAAAKETKDENSMAVEKETPAAPEPSPPVVIPTAPPVAIPGQKFSPIDRFSFDAGEYNSAFVTVYVPLPSVGSIPRDQVTCTFTTTSFDLIVKDLDGKSYRLAKDGLSHDIDPEKSKRIVKADKVIVKLAKTKTDYGSYEYWTDLVDKRKSLTKGKNKENPADGIMDLMKDMYESGDDNMRKVIGETLEKQRRGEIGKDTPKFDDL